MQVARRHINVLELLAVVLALRRLFPLVRGKLVLVGLDNVSVVSYLSKQGGLRSPSLGEEVVKLLSCCEKMQFSVRGGVEHVPGADSVLADTLSLEGRVSALDSKVQGSSVEWHLLSRVCQSIFVRIDRPHVDLFVSSHNFQLPAFFSRVADGLALGQDAFAQDWVGLWAYAFPPIALVPRVLLRVSQTPSCRILLVAPFWPRQLWFPKLLDLLVAEPVRLPELTNLVTISGTHQEIPWGTIQSLRLMVWQISACPSRRRDFLRRLPISLRRQGDLLQEDLILEGSVASRGVFWESD
jgi:hypothetical protein